MTINTLNLRARLRHLSQRARIEQLTLMLADLDAVIASMDGLLDDIERGLPSTAAGDLDTLSLHVDR